MVQNWLNEGPPELDQIECLVLAKSRAYICQNIKLLCFGLLFWGLNFLKTCGS